jgi:hypothetical protein
VNRPVSEFDANSAVTCSAVLPLASPSTLATRRDRPRSGWLPDRDRPC